MVTACRPTCWVSYCTRAMRERRVGRQFPKSGVEETKHAMPYPLCGCAPEMAGAAEGEASSSAETERPLARWQSRPQRRLWGAPKKNIPRAHVQTARARRAAGHTAATEVALGGHKSHYAASAAVDSFSGSQAGKLDSNEKACVLFLVRTMLTCGSFHRSATAGLGTFTPRRQRGPRPSGGYCESGRGYYWWGTAVRQQRGLLQDPRAPAGWDDWPGAAAVPPEPR